MSLSAFLATAKTVNIPSVGVSSVNIQLNRPPSNAYVQVRVYNGGAIPLFILFGIDNTVTATVSQEMPVAPGSIELFSTPTSGNVWAAAIATSNGGGPVYFTPGEGV